MLRVNRHFVWSIFLILVVLVSLLNVNVALADDSTPPPPPTEEPTQPPVEPTEPPVELTEPSVTPTEAPVATETPAATEAPVSDDQSSSTDTSAALETLQQLPDNTQVVVLDENGNILPLASQEAAQVILDTDPMWCPVVAGTPTLPGGAGCTTNFATGQALINDMDSSNPASANSGYEKDGIIYFTANPGGSFALVPGSGSAIDTADYNTLKQYNLILQGGWNGSNGGAATFTGQTNFGTNTLTVGTSGNPWAGNITLTNFAFSGGSSTPVTIYTTNGDITLNNVDVAEKSGGANTAILESTSGDITVQNGSSFDGSNTGNNQNKGFSAETTTGSITISNTSFTDARGCFAFFGFCIVDATVNYNGATLSAPTVTLTNVIANNNDLSGIEINNANVVNLNNVTANGNGTLIFGSGVNVNGTGSTIVNISGGTFNNNSAYGVSVFNGSFNVTSPMTSCSGNTLGCTNDAVPPVLSLPANITTEATSPAGAVVTFSATANDNVDGARTVTCTPASGSTFPIATTTVNCSASDTRGNTANGSFTITVQDTTPPALTLPSNITLEATSSSGAVATFSATATDIVDGPRPVTCTPASGSTFPITSTTVNCSASDTRGNTANGSFTVTVQDTTAPTLTLPSNMTLEATGPSGAVATFSASAADIVDGAVTVTCAPSSGSTFPIATTTVNCSASDSSGNTASGSFTVTVQDTTPPTLTLPSNMTLEATGPSGAVATFSASAADIVDGSRPVTCSPTSGSTFPIATTTVNCSASDLAGNTANGSFIVTVQDTTPPTLTLPANMTLEATGPLGAVVIFSASATDIVDGVVAVTCVPPSGSIFPVATITVNCSASDSNGNTSNGSFTVTVQDTTAPFISPMADIAVITTNKFGEKINYAAPATFDTVDGVGTATCAPASGSFFPLDNTTVICTATDSEGNTSSITFNVYIDYDKPALPNNGGSTGGMILVTGGTPIDLDCNMAVNAFGVIVKFYNLCNQQTIISEVNANSLPGALPSGYTFVKGLDVQVLLNGEAMESLPVASGVELDFPLGDSSEYTVLYWHNDQWVEITQPMNVTELLNILSTDAAVEFYEMSSSNKSSLNVLTTEMTGTFILVKK